MDNNKKTKQIYYEKNKKKILQQHKIWRLKENIKNDEIKLQSEIDGLETALNSTNTLTRILKALLQSKKGLLTYKNYLKKIKNETV